MANRIVAEPNVVAIGDHGVLALIHRERNEVIGLALQSGGSSVGDSRDHSLQIRGCHGDLADDGVADAIRRLRDRTLANHLVRRSRNCGCSLRHSSILAHYQSKVRRTRATGTEAAIHRQGRRHYNEWSWS